ncbi:GNAT family N-acetyltransferase [Staphylococcus sp. SQ8-PEA]|uniref:GNAT family N-acetyltransferase n=1 Tax=Staphylococcus marylandisciuri TaxID=2981529 RepID=A0ABT2QRI1_9STAP|nr:GNAT family N-acetyltransferase [Staphylococcus marylandisciuri]MCU5746593.1 GNAT family N-acetyltransferase [Staphylococcus marylandisciuri]
MKQKGIFGDIIIQEFEEQYRDNLTAFQLNERQQIYTSLPKDVLDEAISDPHQRANIALNKDDEVVGFFVLHAYYQHEGYDTPNQVVYIRSLSVNEKFQGQGYGTQMMMNLPQYVQQCFPDFNHLYLVVDAENKGAWNVYERAGFMHTATKEEGPIGKERLYYLDLDAKYVSSLKLIPGKSEENYNIHIINLEKDNEKIGFVALEKYSTRVNIAAIEVTASERKSGVAQSALRQLATYIRKHFTSITLIRITLYGEYNELRPMCTNSNFVETVTTENYVIFEKFINY